MVFCWKKVWNTFEMSEEKVASNTMFQQLIVEDQED